MAIMDPIKPQILSVRIIPNVAPGLGKKLKLPREKFFTNVDRVGNTSAASIPIALCDAVEAGLLQPDNNIVFVGFGGGLTWASAVIKWDVTPPDVSVLDREWKRTRYIIARGRSRLRRWGRRIGATLGGSPTPDAKLSDVDKKPGS